MGVTSSFSAYEKSYDIENNTSVVRVKISATTSGASYNNYGMYFSVTCNGSSHATYISVGYNSTESYYYDFTVTHDNDGSKTVSCSGYVSTGISAGTLYGSKTLTLTTIPRASDLTAGDGTLGTSQTFSITRKSSSFQHKIVYTYGENYDYILGSENSYDSGVTFSNNVATVSWTPPLSLSSLNTTGTSVSITIKLYTYNSSGTQIGNPSAKTISCTIPSSVVPTNCSLTFSEPSGQGHVTRYGGYIQGQSRIHCSASASGVYGSTISSYSTSINGSVYAGSSFDTSALLSSGSNTATVTAKDSRGRTVSASSSYTVIPYTAPTISKLSVTRCDLDGTENDRGLCIKVTYSYTITSLSNVNTKGAVLKYKKTSDSSWTSISLTAAYSVTDGTQIIPNADDGSSYNVEMQLTDDFYTGNNAIKNQTSVSTAFCIFHIKPDGHGIVFGGIGSNDGFNVKMESTFEEDTTFNSDVTIEGSASVSGSLSVGSDTNAEKQIYFPTSNGATNTHNTYIYGGDGSSTVALGVYDGENDHHVAYYDDSNDEINLYSKASFYNGLTEDIRVLNSGNCNTILESGNYYIGNSGTNKPGSGLNGWLTVKAYSVNSGYCYQRYMTYTGDRYYRMRDNGTWGSWIYDPVYGPKLLWSGTWSSGSITVPNLSDYYLLMFITNDGAILSYLDSVMYGGQNLSGYDGSRYLVFFRCTRSGDTLTWSRCFYSPWSGSTSNIPVLKIYGLVKSSDIQ